ncbi:hypothetical protein CU048_13800 [Beijerinckiaceae bacterium]|nr:hypothetical protein CU048_13800 [Beijerinckiaceae bacterium]
MSRLSRRRDIAIKLSQLYRVAQLHKDRGEILDPAPWLIVFANLLSAAPEKWLGDRKARSAPEWFGLSVSTLSLAARRAGLSVDLDHIRAQVAATEQWRGKESVRLGRNHYVAMRGDTIGRLLGITAEVRRDAAAWTIVPYGVTREELMQQYTERQRCRARDKKRANGAKPHDQSLSRTKPWKKLAMSRRTWERRRAAGTLPELMDSATISEPVSANRILH